MVGMWSDEIGARLWEVVPEVWNKRAAELHGVERVVKLAAHLGSRIYTSGWTTSQPFGPFCVGGQRYTIGLVKILLGGEGGPWNPRNFGGGLRKGALRATS